MCYQRHTQTINNIVNYVKRGRGIKNKNICFFRKDKKESIWKYTVTCQVISHFALKSTLI